MPLFADETSVWGAAASLGCAGLAAVFAWLTNRDRIRHDARTAVLESKVAACEDDRSRLARLYDALVEQLRAVGVLPSDPPQTGP